MQGEVACGTKLDFAKIRRRSRPLSLAEDTVSYVGRLARRNLASYSFGKCIFLTPHEVHGHAEMICAIHSTTDLPPSSNAILHEEGASSASNAQRLARVGDFHFSDLASNATRGGLSNLGDLTAVQNGRGDFDLDSGCAIGGNGFGKPPYK